MLDEPLPTQNQAAPPIWAEPEGIKTARAKLCSRLLNAEWPRFSTAGGHSVRLTLFPDPWARTKTEQTITLAAVALRIQIAGAPTKAGLPWVKLARFGDQRSEKGSLRHDANVIGVSGVEGDYDGETLGFDEACETIRRVGLLALVYTSPSYTPEKPRWRVLCPFSVQLGRKQRAPMMARLNGVYGGVFGSESFALSQSYFYGAVGDNLPPRVEIIDGTPIDLRSDLDAAAIGKPAKTAAAVAPKETTAIDIAGKAPAVVAARPSTMTAAAQAGLPNATDNSRSGIAFRIAHEMRLEGKTFEEFCERVRTDTDTASWYTEKGILNNNRELRRAWDRAGNTTVVDGSDTPAPPITVGAPISQLPHIMDEGAARDHLNARLFKVNDWGGSPCFGRFDPTGRAARLKPADLPVLLAGHFVAVADGKGGTKHVPAATWWVQCPSKQEFDCVIYDPEGKQAVQAGQSLNLWEGFAVRPVKGCWRRMRRHLWLVICGRDRHAFKYLVRWLAHVVQHPGTNPEVMVVLRSDLEGVGKSSIGQWLLRIFGAHGLEVADYKRVFGDFNDGLDAKSFVLLEEPAFPGDHQAAAVLRATLTAQTVRINPKNYPSYDVPHRLHFMMTTNGAWAVPAGAEARRFLMLDARQKMDRAYFDALWAEAEGGGIAAMLHDLLRLDLYHFNVRDVPATAALVEQQRRSADDVSKWIADAIVTGEIVPGSPGGGFGTPQTTAALHGAYRIWCEAQRIRRPKSAVEFGRILSAMRLTCARTNNQRRWLIPDPAAVLAASDRRAGIRVRS